MRKELNKLRKMQVGWFGKEKNVVKKEVIVQNNHYLEEKERVVRELNNWQSKYSLLEKERNDLLARLRALESQLHAEMRKEKNVVQIKEDNTDFEALILQYKNKIAALQAEIDKQNQIIESQRLQITSKVNESKTVNVMHVDDTHFKQEISLLNQRINDLKIENDKY